MANKQQLNEVFRLQQLAGLKPVNEYFFFHQPGDEASDDSEEAPLKKSSGAYAYATFPEFDRFIDDSDQQVQVDAEELEAKGYKKLEFNSFKELVNSAFAKKNTDIAWELMHPGGEKYFNMYAKEYGLPFTVYVQDSILERKK